MTRFISTRLDLSRLRSVRPDIILDIDFEKILKDRLDAIKAERPDLEAINLETSPLKILQEQDAYRQTLDYNLLNETLRALLPALSTGTNLEHIAARSGITRLKVGVDDQGNDVFEDDDTFRMRYFASFGAPAAGSEDAYVFGVMSAYPEAWHVQCIGPDEHGIPGQVDVVVTAPNGQAVPDSVINTINLALNGRKARPLTDIVNVLPAVVVPYAVDLTAQILRGPDPAAIGMDIRLRLEKIVAERYRGGGEVPIAVLKSAGFDAGALDVLVASPLAPIPRDPYKSPYCTGIQVQVMERLND
jgi:phage-related baseplate assembly protein